MPPVPSYSPTLLHSFPSHGGGCAVTSRPDAAAPGGAQFWGTEGKALVAGLGPPQVLKRMISNPQESPQAANCRDCQEPGHSPGWPQANVVTGLIGKRLDLLGRLKAPGPGVQGPRRAAFMALFPQVRS